MKKFYSVFLCLTIYLSAFGYDFEIGGIYYNIVGNSEVEVTYGEGYSGAITIPSSVTFEETTYNVTAIGNMAFSGCSGLTSVSIPNSVTTIGNYAFSNCISLASISIDAGNSHYDSRNNCNAVIETSTNKLIFGCMNTVIPNGVIAIGEEAFWGCSGLTSVNIPNGVTTIGYYAFSWCENLTSVVIPNSVTFIEDGAFYNCPNLTSIAIPKSAMPIESYFLDADYACHVSDVIINQGVDSIPNDAFRQCRGLTSVTIPNSVTTIGDYAFSNCDSLISVNIPNSVTTIGESAFSGCRGLTSVSIPNSVTTIGYEAFYGCWNLTSVTIPNSVTAIGIYAFAGCSSLASISVDAGNSHYDSRNSCNAIIETSTNKLIQGCMNTVIPNGVIVIGAEAFGNCSGLTSVVIPSSVTSIENGAFGGCDNILDITCYATTPPTLQQYTFSDYNPTVYVPASSVSLYSAKAYWKNFYIQPIPGESHVITVNSNDDQMGITMGSGTFEKNTSTQLIAITQAGYSFLQWNDGNTDNPRNVLVTSDSTFTAEFGVSGANDTIYLEYDGTSAMQYALEDYGVYYFNGKVYNSNNMYIKLYYSDGRLVSSGKKDIDMSMYVNGIYIVTDGKGGFLKINHYQNR